MKDIPAYSEEAREVRDLFLSEGVSYIFYFEDSQHEAVYERLLMRLLPDIKPFAVDCPGGKTKVIAKAKADRIPDVQQIFVLDKDFDDLLDEIVTVPDLFYLKCYSIEHYLASKEGLLALAIELNPRNLTMARALEKCSHFETFAGNLIARLVHVTRLFVVARKFRVAIETTKIRVDELLDGADADSPMPTDEWIIDYRAAMQASTYGGNEWLSDDTALDVAIDSALTPPELSSFPVVADQDHICGKHLLGCLVRFVQRQLEVDLKALDPVEFYMRLVAHTDLSRLGYLAASLTGHYPALVR